MYCKFCKKNVSDGKYCNVCRNNLDTEEKKLNNIMSGIDWFQTFMMIGLIVWLVLYIVIGVIVVYNANGKKGGYDDYSIAFSFFVITSIVEPEPDIANAQSYFFNASFILK